VNVHCSSYILLRLRFEKWHESTVACRGNRLERAPSTKRFEGLVMNFYAINFLRSANEFRLFTRGILHKKGNRVN